MSETDVKAPHLLSGKVVLITGGSRGIGAAIARRFAAVGSRVAIGYRSGGDAAKAVLSSIADLGAEALGVQGDIADAMAARELVATTVARFGQLDILVNCAGIAPYRPFEAVDAAFVNAMFETNVLGTVLVMQAALPHLPSPGGRIINFSSAMATRPVPTSSIYAASKAAISTLSHALSKELGSRGITVNAVAPGVIETEMTKEILAQRGDAIVAQTPLGRIGQTDDIAGLVLFLASPEAGWITGRTIIADGGIS